MKPEHQERRKIIREWMARKTMERIAFRPDPYRQIVSWVQPRAGRQ